MDLPWEMIEEILSRVPPTSLVRFRTVCKQWNALFDDKMFINNHKETFRFVLATKSKKMYAVSIDPKVEVRELELDISGLENQKPNILIDCNEFLLCGMDDGAVVWNPWLKQTRWISEANQPGFEFHGIGYEYNNERLEESGYKTMASYLKDLDSTDDEVCWSFHELSSDEWKDLPDSDSDGEEPMLHTQSGVSLNGLLYWLSFYDKADPLYHLQNYNCSNQKFIKFCDLPCGVNHECDALVLNVYKGDRLSLLKQSYETKKIEVWVTKNKIIYEDGHDVVWMNFMTFSVANLPGLFSAEAHSQPSYFIKDNRLYVCSYDETGGVWIYILGENKLLRKIQIDSVVDPWPLHCTYIPSLIPIPHSKRIQV